MRVEHFGNSLNTILKNNPILICSDGFTRFFSSIYDKTDPDHGDLTININASSVLHLNKVVEMRPERLSDAQISFYDNLHITPLEPLESI